MFHTFIFISQDWNKNPYFMAKKNKIHSIQPSGICFSNWLNYVKRGGKKQKRKKRKRNSTKNLISHCSRCWDSKYFFVGKYFLIGRLSSHEHYYLNHLWSSNVEWKSLIARAPAYMSPYVWPLVTQDTWKDPLGWWNNVSCS